MSTPKAKTMLLLSGETVKVHTVHYAAGERHWRVSWIDEKSTRPKGCVAELVGDRFEEAEDGWQHAPVRQDQPTNTD